MNKHYLFLLKVLTHFDILSNKFVNQVVQVALDTALKYSLNALTACSGLEQWIKRNFHLIVRKRRKSHRVKSGL